MTDYSSNGSVAPLIPGDAYLSQGVYTGDVHMDGNVVVGNVSSVVPAPVEIKLGTGSVAGTVCSVLVGDTLSKIQFFAGTTPAPIVQQNTGVSPATITGTVQVATNNGTTGNMVDISTTFGGYTITQVVAALKNYNLLD